MKALKILVGSGFGSGFIRPAPGTWGSILAYVIGFVAYEYIENVGYFSTVMCVCCIALSFWSSKTCEEKWGKDPSTFVMDEWAGMFLTFALLLELPFFSVPFDLRNLTIALILFRIFDITKVLGINSLQNLKGGFGILLDDLLAGVYAWLCTLLLYQLLP